MGEDGAGLIWITEREGCVTENNSFPYGSSFPSFSLLQSPRTRTHNSRETPIYSKKAVVRGFPPRWLCRLLKQWGRNRGMPSKKRGVEKCSCPVLDFSTGNVAFLYK